MMSSADSPAGRRSTHDDAEFRQAHPEPTPQVRPSTLVAVVGMFALASVVVLLVSWPGLQVARHTRKAECALEGHQWAEAVPHLETITARFPDAWLRQRQLGDCYLELGEAEKALAAYQRSQQSAPEQDLRSRVGRALFLLNPASAEAMQTMEAAQRENPTDARANFYVALLRLKQERYREAAYYFLGATNEPHWFERSRPYIEEIRVRLLGEEPASDRKPAGDASGEKDLL